MSVNKPDRMTSFLVGIGAVVVTLFMTSGHLDIFDFGLSLILLLFGVLFLKDSGIKVEDKYERLIVSLIFGVISTSIVLAVLIFIGVLTDIEILARVDFESYKFYFYRPGNVQHSILLKFHVISQVTLFALCTLVWYFVLRKYTKSN